MSIMDVVTPSIQDRYDTALREYRKSCHAYQIANDYKQGCLKELNQATLILVERLQENLKDPTDVGDTVTDTVTDTIGKELK